MKSKVEILAPAGSWESMVAAINAGADAVYMGGSRFGARAYADNPEEDRFLEAIDYAHLHGCSLYMTVNTLVKDEELDQLFAYLLPYYERGLDGVIVQDLGVFSLIHRKFPGLPIHASTQMTITGYHGARILKEMGASRIVTARELSLEEIRTIREHVDIEIESFVHGALCYCYSGQCLLSSFIGGRSGNRGRCAQPCRLPYEVKRDGKSIGKSNERFVMSLKDLCTLDILPDIIDAGVYSLKIEGRMKSPRYTAGVVRAYRKYVDMYLEIGRSGYRVDPKDREMLLELFDRGGLTEGYYQNHNGASMVSLQEKPSFRQGNQTLFEYLDKEYIEKKKQEPICGTVTIKEGEPVLLTLTLCGGKNGTIEASVTGPVAESAQRQPLTEETLKKQLHKTGNSPFYFETLEVIIEGNCFLPVQAINDLRRSGIEELVCGVQQSFMRESLIAKSVMSVSTIETEHSGIMRIHVSLEDKRGLQAVLSSREVDLIALDAVGFEASEWKHCAEACHKAGKKCALLLPHIFRTEAERYFRKHQKELKEAGFDELVVRSLEEVDFLRELNNVIPMVFDYGMYAMNGLATFSMLQLGAIRQTLPLELNSRELEVLNCHGKELIGYGYLPAMISAQCIYKTTKGCKKTPELLMMRDRTGKELPVKNHCRFCYNTIYNPSPLSLLGQEAMVKRLGPEVLRLSFTIETPQQIREIVDVFAEHFIYNRNTSASFTDFTRGHFKRGVE